MHFNGLVALFQQIIVDDKMYWLQSIIMTKVAVGVASPHRCGNTCEAVLRADTPRWHPSSRQWHDNRSDHTLGAPEDQHPTESACPPAASSAAS